MEFLLKRIKKSPFFGIVTDEVTDIANIQNLVTFVKLYDEEKGKAETVFIDSTDLLQFSETNAANSKTIYNCLNNLISSLGLELKNLKAFAFDAASDITSVNNGVAEQLRENQDLTHILNIHCICHRLALACADSSSQLTVLKDFEDVLISL